jgi:hypothetical protein
VPRIREWWSSAQRAGEQKAAAEAAAAHERVIAGISSLRDLPDDELIAKVGPRNTFTPPHEEMEMQRRLKDAIPDPDRREQEGADLGSVGYGGNGAAGHRWDRANRGTDQAWLDKASHAA